MYISRATYWVVPHEKILLSERDPKRYWLVPRGHDFCLSIVYKRNPYLYSFCEKVRGERERNLNPFSGSRPGGKRERQRQNFKRHDRQNPLGSCLRIHRIWGLHMYGQIIDLLVVWYGRAELGRIKSTAQSGGSRPHPAYGSTTAASTALVLTRQHPGYLNFILSQCKRHDHRIRGKK